MDDVTSGFNIGANVSLRSGFSEVLGFTEAEVRDMLETYRRAGVFDQDPDAVLALMREWYDGYRFAKGATRDLYNTDMVLVLLAGVHRQRDATGRVHRQQHPHRLREAAPPAAGQPPGECASGGRGSGWMHRSTSPPARPS